MQALLAEIQEAQGASGVTEIFLDRDPHYFGATRSCFGTKEAATGTVDILTALFWVVVCRSLAELSTDAALGGRPKYQYAGCPGGGSLLQHDGASG